MDELEFFAPWRILGVFGDGSRLTFDGLTEGQAYDRMLEAAADHDDLRYWLHVTDQNYEDGQYYKLLNHPEPPAVHIVDFTGYDGPLDENGFPVGLPDEIAQYAKEQGAAPDAPQIIIKRNAPPDPPHEK